MRARAPGGGRRRGAGDRRQPLDRHRHRAAAAETRAATCSSAAGSSVAKRRSRRCARQSSATGPPATAASAASEREAGRTPSPGAPPRRHRWPSARLPVRARRQVGGERARRARRRRTPAGTRHRERGAARAPDRSRGPPAGGDQRHAPQRADDPEERGRHREPGSGDEGRVAVVAGGASARPTATSPAPRCSNSARAWRASSPRRPRRSPRPGARRRAAARRGRRASTRRRHLSADGPSGRPEPASSTSVSSRASASCVPLAWIVDSEPSCPVLSACSMSSASAPRTSPTTMRSGRIRSAARTSSRTATPPTPSAFGGRASSRTTCGWPSRSSAVSSMVTIRSVCGTACDKVFSSVVFPALGAPGDEEVPPGVDRPAQERRPRRRRHRSRRARRRGRRSGGW